MRNSCEQNSAMLKSANSLEFADSSKRNHSFSVLEQLNDRTNQQKLQRKSHEKIDQKEHQKADLDLKNDIEKLEIITQDNLNNFIKIQFSGNEKIYDFAKKYLNRQNILGRKLSKKELKKHLNFEFENELNVSIADKIKNYKEELTEQGKSQTEILQILISKFKNEESVSVWVENWRNFQKLSKFAESKPPKERQAIQNLIAKADFTSENAFATSLTEVAQSSEISNETKLEISREFSGADVFSVNDMDYTLKEVKNHKEKIEKAIGTKSHEKKSLDSEIGELENELEKLPLDDDLKRQKLEEKIEQKKEALKRTESEIDRLEKGKPKDLSFTFREGFSARLNPDGSRSIRINSQDFSIKLPSNKWLFSNKKNIRTVNLAFPYIALKNQNIADSLFSPNLNNNSIPSKSQIDMGHLIISTLGFDDTKILSNENIKQLNKDLSKLTLGIGVGQENLIGLGIYDIYSQSINKGKLRMVLQVIRENRDLKDEVCFEKLKRLS